MATNRKAKTRPVDNPYEEFVQGTWTWRVLKHYQTKTNELNNKFARVFCAVKSPYTYDDWEYGDTYTKDIPGYRWDGEE
jgi:hypothetical protein